MLCLCGRWKVHVAVRSVSLTGEVCVWVCVGGWWGGGYHTTALLDVTSVGSRCSNQFHNKKAQFPLALYLHPTTNYSAVAMGSLLIGLISVQNCP